MRGCGTSELSGGRELSGVVAQRAAFGQAVEFFRQILGMVADALQRLGGEKDVEILLAGRAVGLGQVSLKQGVAQAVDVRIGLQNSLGM